MRLAWFRPAINNLHKPMRGLPKLPLMARRLAQPTQVPSGSSQAPKLPWLHQTAGSAVNTVGPVGPAVNTVGPVGPAINASCLTGPASPTQPSMPLARPYQSSKRLASFRPATNTVGLVGPSHSRNYASSTSQCADS